MVNVLKEPFCPPRSPLPTAVAHPSSLPECRESLFHAQNFTDVILVCGRVGFSAHRFLLAASSPLFGRILSADFAVVGDSEHANTTPRSNSEASLVRTLLHFGLV